MAAGAGIPEIDEIDSAEKLEAYLRGKPIEWAQQIAWRAAFRVFPFVLQLDENMPYILQAWRVLFISQLTLRTMKVKVTHTATYLMMVNGANVSANTLPVYAGVDTRNSLRDHLGFAHSAAMHAANAVVNADLQKQPSVYALEQATSAVKLAALINSDIAWRQIRNDLKLLNEDSNIRSRDLFSTNRNGHIGSETILGSDFDQSLILKFRELERVKDTPLVIIADWFDKLVKTNFTQTPWGDICGNRDGEIGSKDNGFWEREPDEVLADIAKIVGWPDYGHTQKSKTEVINQLALSASPEPTLDDDDRLDVQPNQEFDKPFAVEGLAELPITQVTLANVIAQGLRLNTPPIVKPSLLAYAEHLAKYGAQPILGILKPLAEMVKAEFDASDSDIWDRGSRVGFDTWWSNHLLLIEHFPINAELEDLIANTQFNLDAAYSADIEELYKDLLDYVPVLYNDNHVTEAFAKFMEGLEEQLYYVKTVPPRSNNDFNAPLKRFVLRTFGVFKQLILFIDGTVMRLAAGASLASVYWSVELKARLLPLVDALVKLIF